MALDVMLNIIDLALEGKREALLGEEKIRMGS